MMDWMARAQVLETELQRANDTIATLREAMGMTFEAPIILGLTPSESRVLGVLLKREACNKQQIMIALYADRPDIGETVEPKIVDVFVCKLRKKVEPHGITIQTLWGHGFAMPVASKQRVAELVAASAAAAGRAA